MVILLGSWLVGVISPLGGVIELQRVGERSWSNVDDDGALEVGEHSYGTKTLTASGECVREAGGDCLVMILVETLASTLSYMDRVRLNSVGREAGLCGDILSSWHSLCLVNVVLGLENPDSAERSATDVWDVSAKEFLELRGSTIELPLSFSVFSEVLYRKLFAFSAWSNASDSTSALLFHTGEWDPFVSSYK